MVREGLNRGSSGFKTVSGGKLKGKPTHVRNFF